MCLDAADAAADAAEHMPLGHSVIAKCTSAAAAAADVMSFEQFMLCK